MVAPISSTTFTIPIIDGLLFSGREGAYGNGIGVLHDGLHVVACFEGNVAFIFDLVSFPAKKE